MQNKFGEEDKTEEEVIMIQMPENLSTSSISDRIEKLLAAKREKDPDFKAKDGIMLLLMTCFKKEFFTALAIGFLADFTGVMNLFSTTFLIAWLRDGNAANWPGYFYVVLLSTLLSISSYSKNYFLMTTLKIGISVRKGLSGIIFKKIMRFNAKSCAKSTTGKLISIVSGELQLLERGLVFITVLVTGPIILIFALFLLSFTFKEGVIFGFIVGLIIISLETWAALYIKHLRYKEGYFSERRLKSITDIINGIRTIKAYAWELPFFKLVNKYRKKMVVTTIKNQTIESSMWGLTMGGGQIMSIAIFGYHYARGREFNYENSLASLAILGYISSVMFFQFSIAISMFSSFKAILKRVGEVMDLEEQKETTNRNLEEKIGKERIKFENASLTWGFSIRKGAKGSKIDEELHDINLKNINFSAIDGELTAIVGSVGCGKSTFLSAIMNELITLEGKVSDL